MIISDAQLVTVKDSLFKNERGATWQNTQWYSTLDNGTLIIKGLYHAGLPTFVQDKNGNYQDHILSTLDDIIQIETGQASFVYDRNTCAITVWSGGLISNREPLILSDSWVVQRTTDKTIDWQNDPTNSRDCDTRLSITQSGTFITATKDDGKTKYEVRYAKFIGRDGFETFTTIMNNDPTRTDQKYAQAESLILNPNATAIEQDDSLIITSPNGGYLQLGYAKSKQDLQDIDTKTKDQITFNYQNVTTILDFGDTKTLDPIFENDSGSYVRRAFTASGVGNCNTLADGGFNSSPQIRIQTTTGICRLGMGEWDLTPASADWIVQSGSLEWDAVASVSLARDCAWSPISQQPSTATDSSDMITDILSGGFVTASVSECTSVTSNINYSLTATGIDDLNTKINAGSTWAGFGYRFVDMSRDASDRFTSLGTGGTAELAFLYLTGTMNPSPPIAVQAVGLNSSIAVTWIPKNATYVNDYTVWNSSDATTYDDLATTGDNGTFYNIHLGQLADEFNSYFISSISINNGTNSTATNATADTIPITITGGVGVGISSTEIILNWSAPNDGGNGINQYDIRFTNSTDFSWQTIDNGVTGIVFDPMFYFKFDGDIHDSMNSSQVLLQVGGAENYTQGLNSTLDGIAILGDRATKYIGDNDIWSDSLNFNITDPFSISLWINATEDGTTRDVIGKRQSGSGRGYALSMTSSNQLLFLIEGTGGENTQDRIVNSEVDFTDGMAKHVVVSYNATGANTVVDVGWWINGTYHDGDNFDLDVIVSTIQTGIAQRPTIMGAHDGSATEWAGGMDNVRLMNYSLTQQDVDDLYQNNSPPTRANLTGLAQDEIVTWQVRSCNDVGCSAYSANFTGATFTNPVMSIAVSQVQVGDAIALTPTITLVVGDPQPITITDLDLFNVTTLVQANTTNIALTQGSPITYGAFFDDQMTTSAISNYTFIVTVTNSTGASFDDNSSSILISAEYNPDFVNAISVDVIPSGVNWTSSRTDPTEVQLSVNRPLTSGVWDLNCNIVTGYGQDGVWQNETDVGLWQNNFTTGFGTNVYYTCYNPDDLVFNHVSYGNLTGILIGFAGLSDQMGTFFGLPLVFMFVLFIASMFTGKNAGTGLLIVMITVGILAGLGAISFGENVWGILMILTAIGLFGIKKFL